MGRPGISGFQSGYQLFLKKGWLPVSVSAKGLPIPFFLKNWIMAFVLVY